MFLLLHKFLKLNLIELVYRYSSGDKFTVMKEPETVSVGGQKGAESSISAIGVTFLFESC